jgi:hypothetical protein
LFQFLDLGAVLAADLAHRRELVLTEAEFFEVCRQRAARRRLLVGGFLVLAHQQATQQGDRQHGQPQAQTVH